MPKKHLKTLVLLLSVIILALLFIFSKKSTVEKTQPNLFSDKSFKSYAVYAKENGPQKAYQLLKENYPQNNPEAHDFAHVIGISSYEQIGPSGLKICDSAYNYGCFHGYIEAFLVEKGTVAIKEIEKNCLALGTVHAPSCLHGIGHGVLAGQAYKLNESLSDCDVMQKSYRIYCWDGVFMERIDGSMQNPKDKAQLNLDNLMEPCNKIPETYKEQCYRNQVTLWSSYFTGNNNEVGKLCSEIEKNYQKTCIESIGLRNTMRAQENQEELLKLCKILPGDNFSDDCLIGELKELLFEGKSATIAQNLCNYTSQAGKQECFSTFRAHYEQSRLRFGN